MAFNSSNGTITSTAPATATAATTTTGNPNHQKMESGAPSPMTNHRGPSPPISQNIMHQMGGTGGATARKHRHDDEEQGKLFVGGLR